MSTYHVHIKELQPKSVAECFDFTARHQRASGIYHVMTFDSPDTLHSKGIT